MSAPAVGAPRACGAELRPIRRENMPLRPADLIMRNVNSSLAVRSMKSAACSA
jgi:hypothetical protein